MNARPIHRMLSFIIDLIVTGSMAIIIGYPVWIALIEALIHHSDEAIWTLFYTGTIVVPIIVILMMSYYLVLPLLWKYQTIGRFLTRIAIVKEDGTPVDFQTLFVREVIGRMFAGFMSLGLSLFSDAILISQPTRRAYSDLLARTRVIDL